MHSNALSFFPNRAKPLLSNILAYPSDSWVHQNSCRLLEFGIISPFSVNTINSRIRLRNQRIGLKQRPVEWVFAVAKQVFRGGHVLITSLPRVRVKMVFVCFCFYLMH